MPNIIRYTVSVNVYSHTMQLDMSSAVDGSEDDWREANEDDDDFKSFLGRVLDGTEPGWPVVAHAGGMNERVWNAAIYGNGAGGADAFIVEDA